MSKALVDDANNRVVQLLIKRPVQSSFKSVQDDVTECDAVKFVEDIQKLVVKVALIMSELSLSDNFDDNGDYKSAIKFLCKKVLKENGLYDDLENFVSKTHANKIKSADEKRAVIGAGANMYNAMIYQLATSFELPSLGNLYITAPIGGVKESPKKSAEETEQPKKQDKPAEKEQPKKQDKRAEKEQAKKQDKPAEKEQPKKQDKNAEVVEQPKKTNSLHQAKAKANFIDDAVGTLTVEIMRGDGWYERNLPRKDYFQFLLEINFEGKYELKSSQVTINSLKVDKSEIQDLIKNKDMTVKHGRNEIDIEMDRQGMRNFLADKCCDNINRLPTEVSVTVIATVKSGLTKTKKLPCDVTGLF